MLHGVRTNATSMIASHASAQSEQVVSPQRAASSFYISEQRADESVHTARSLGRFTRYAVSLVFLQ